MTGVVWYQEVRHPGIGTRNNRCWAYSVRPDLWGPGYVVWLGPGSWKLGGRILANAGKPTTRLQQPDPCPAYTVPGAAEALILSGVLESMTTGFCSLAWDVRP